LKKTVIDLQQTAYRYALPPHTSEQIFNDTKCFLIHVIVSFYSHPGRSRNVSHRKVVLCPFYSPFSNIHDHRGGGVRLALDMIIKNHHPGRGIRQTRIRIYVTLPVAQVNNSFEGLFNEHFVTKGLFTSLTPSGFVELKITLTPLLKG
jgi:hypothetical protein